MSHIPVKWTSEQIREIVRDEMAKIARENQAVANAEMSVFRAGLRAKIDAEKTAVAAAEMSVFRAGLRAKIEEHMNDMDVPEHLRADIRFLAERLIGD